MHRVKVDNGKYEFVHRGGWKIDILRGSELWVEDVDGPKAIASMMAELDAARVVVEQARLTVAAARDGKCPSLALQRAVELHDRLCDDREPPTQWARAATPGCGCAGGDAGGHDLDCKLRNA